MLAVGRVVFELFRHKVPKVGRVSTRSKQQQRRRQWQQWQQRQPFSTTAASTLAAPAVAANVEEAVVAEALLPAIAVNTCLTWRCMHRYSVPSSHCSAQWVVAVSCTQNWCCAAHSPPRWYGDDRSTMHAAVCRLVVKHCTQWLAAPCVCSSGADGALFSTPITCEDSHPLTTPSQVANQAVPIVLLPRPPTTSCGCAVAA